MTVRLIIFCILILNLMSAAFFREYYLHKKSANLISYVRQYTDDTNDKKYVTNYYLVAGFMNQATSAFTFLDKALEHDCNLYYVNYSNFGYDPESYAIAIHEKCQEVTKLQFSEKKIVKNIAVSISLGDQAISQVEPMMNDAIAINPCTYRKFLQGKYRIAIATTRPFLIVTKYLLGWLGFIPLVEVDHNRFSVTLIIDQLLAMVDHAPTEGMNDYLRNRKIILSEQDQFLDNVAIASYYKKSNIVYIDCAHATTCDINDAQSYLSGVKQLWRQPEAFGLTYPWRRQYYFPK